MDEASEFELNDTLSLFLSLLILLDLLALMHVPITILLSRVVFRPTQFTPSPQLQCTQYHEISPEWQCSILSIAQNLLHICY